MTLLFMFPSLSQRPNGELGFRFFFFFLKKKEGKIVKYLSLFYSGGSPALSVVFLILAFILSCANNSTIMHYNI
jgi:hypothetical protein